MPLHMIKLCVGVSEVETLEANAARSDWRIVHTRMTPKRAAEIEDGGSDPALSVFEAKAWVPDRPDGRPG